MAAAVLPKHNGALSPGTHLTVQATGRNTAHTHTCLPTSTTIKSGMHRRENNQVPSDAGLPQNAVELRLFRVLATDVADLGLGIIRDEPRLIHWD